MSRLTKEQEVLIREYEEAGRTCRWYEHLRRLNLFLFAALTSAIIGFVQSQKFSSGANIPLELFGILIGITIWNGEKRISDYYRFYIMRAKEIEEELGMSLYREGWEKIHKTETFSLKLLFQLIPLSIVVYFIFLIIYQIYKELWFERYWWLFIILICVGVISIRERRKIKIMYKRLIERLKQISHIIFT